MAQRFIAARDAYELSLSRIWEDVLHRDGVGMTGVGMTHDFFDLGGDLAMAEAVLIAIAAQFDAPLSMTSFLEEPTIERVACHLRARSQKLNEEPLVALQPSGSKRPFFFLPGGEGDALNFHDLAVRMAPDQPLYSLHTRGLYGDHPPFHCVEDMAADHLESIRTVQPRGPYLLGGHCTGAVTALEIALQLQRRGERVAVLAACDAMAPAVARPFIKDATYLEDLAEFCSILATGFECWFGVDIGYSEQEMRALDPDRRVTHFMNLARQHGVYTPDAPDERLERIVALYRSVSDDDYLPGEPFAGPITYVRARDSGLGELLTKGWQELSAQPLRLRMVPGDHVSFLTEPHVEVLAREIRAAIAQAEAS